MDTIKALAEILRKAQGIEDRETRETIDVGYECVTIREEHDAMRKEIEQLRQLLCEALDSEISDYWYVRVREALGHE